MTGIGQNTANIYSAPAYNTRGQLTGYNLGNGLATTKSYSTNGLLTGISTPGIQNLAYDFNTQTGNLNWRKDAAKIITENFTYDNLMKNRLETSQVNTGTTFTNQYLANGNINTKTGLGTFAYSGTQPHAVSGVDNTDNIISSTTQTIDYTAFNKVELIEEIDEHKMVFTYGPNNQRKKTELYNWVNNNWQLQKTKGELHVKIAGMYNQTSFRLANDYLSLINFGSNGNLSYGSELEYLIRFNRNKFGLFAEVSYGEYSAEYKDEHSGLTSTLDYEFIEFPVGLSCRFNLSENLSLFVKTGFVPNMVLNNSSISVYREENDYSPISSMNGLVSFGGSYKRLYAEARFYSNRDIMQGIYFSKSEFKQLPFRLSYSLFKIEGK